MTATTASTRTAMGWVLGHATGRIRRAVLWGTENGRRRYIIVARATRTSMTCGGLRRHGKLRRLEGGEEVPEDGELTRSTKSSSARLGEAGDDGERARRWRPEAEKNRAAGATRGGSGRFLWQRGIGDHGGATGGLRFGRGGPQRRRRARDDGGATSAMALARVRFSIRKTGSKGGVEVREDVG